MWVTGLLGGLLWLCGGLWELGMCCRADWDLIRTLKKYRKRDPLKTPELRFGLIKKATVGKQTIT